MKTRFVKIRFSLRTFLLTAGIMCCLLVLLAHELHRARTQHRVASLIRSTGGEVYYDCDPGYTGDPSLDSPIRRWFRRSFGNVVFGRIRDVRFGPKSRPEDVDLLSRLPAVKQVGFVGVHITATHLRRLTRYREVTCLYLDKCTFGRGMYGELSRLTWLESLRIAPDLRYRIDMQFICRMDSLQHLEISGATVDLSEFEELSECRKLKTLDVDGCTLVGSLRYIGQLSSLESLRLSNTNMQPRELRFLQPLHQLRELDLMQTATSDEDLASLAQIRSLRVVLLAGTRVTETGLRELRDRLGTQATIGYGDLSKAIPVNSPKH